MAPQTPPSARPSARPRRRVLAPVVAAAALTLALAGPAAQAQPTPAQPNVTQQAGENPALTVLEQPRTQNLQEPGNHTFTARFSNPRQAPAENVSIRLKNLSDGSSAEAAPTNQFVEGDTLVAEYTFFVDEGQSFELVGTATNTNGQVSTDPVTVFGPGATVPEIGKFPSGVSVPAGSNFRIDLQLSPRGGTVTFDESGDGGKTWTKMPDVPVKDPVLSAAELKDLGLAASLTCSDDAQEKCTATFAGAANEKIAQKNFRVVVSSGKPYFSNSLAIQLAKPAATQSSAPSVPPRETMEARAPQERPTDYLPWALAGAAALGLLGLGATGLRDRKQRPR